jgi:hypothetical protein
VFLVLVLYDLFKDVDRRYARLMVTLVAISVAFELVNCLNLLAPLVLLSGADFLSAFTKAQLDALAMVFLKLRNEGLGIVSALWGLWLLPLGLLVIRSRFIPRILGILLIIACFAYLAESVTSVVFPAATHMVSSITTPIGGIGELLFVLWLLVKGANAQSREALPA